MLRRGIWLALLGGGLVVVLRVFPPGLSWFYPECPVYAWTGMLCPGCGATRALGALASGAWLEALRSNALVVLLLPVLAGYGLAGWPPVPRRVGFGLVIMTLGYGVGRNVLAG